LQPARRANPTGLRQGEQAESMGHHEFTNTEGYERQSDIIDLPLPTPHS
jgi:hypothetical protein